MHTECLSWWYWPASASGWKDSSRCSVGPACPRLQNISHPKEASILKSAHGREMCESLENKSFQYKSTFFFFVHLLYFKQKSSQLTQKQNSVEKSQRQYDKHNHQCFPQGNLMGCHSFQCYVGGKKCNEVSQPEGSRRVPQSCRAGYEGSTPQFGMEMLLVLVQAFPLSTGFCLLALPWHTKQSCHQQDMGLA